MSPVLEKRQAGTPTHQVMTRFLRYATRFATNTQRHYKDTLFRLSPYLPRVIEKVTPEHLDIFVQSLKMANSSKNARLTPVRSFFRYCEDYLGLPNPTKAVKKLPELPPRQRVVTEDEYEKILAVANPHEKAVIQFLANTGLRSAEFCSLTKNNVSSDKTYLNIIGKGQKRRCVPLNETCQKNLSLIFSKSYTRNKLYNLTKSLARRANLPVFGPHALRHRFCTILLIKGVNIAIVSRILGHSSIAVTEKIYLHLKTPDFLGVTDVLD